MSHGSRQISRNSRAVGPATWLIAIAVLALLAVVAVGRRGNLAWDDADYLRRALANARISRSAGPLMFLPLAVECVLREHPKPPWLVAWIQTGAIVFDRHHLDALILYASVVPYAILLAAVVYLGRWLGGAVGGLAALAFVIASPTSLAFGAKVMVETFLSLWVLLAYALTCRLLANPSRRAGARAGTVVGLALLTKLTTVLFLPVPLAFILVRLARGGPDRRALLRSLAWAAVIAATIAGPWYALNAGQAVAFARFSSNYSQIAESRATSISPGERLVLFANDIVGWPLAATLCGGALLGAVLVFRHRHRGNPDLDVMGLTDRQAQFSMMAWLGAGTATAVLLYPTYFDPRFLMPIWPVLAVDLGSRFSRASPRFPLVPRIVLCAGLAASVTSAALLVVQTPRLTTYWNTAALLDDLVRKYGTYTLGNVGNCPDWNVCKTGLINELRDQPATCFVLHDLTKLAGPEALRHLHQFDAIVVLGQDHLPESLRMRTPGLNRSYDVLARAVADDPMFARVTTPTIEGLPELRLYIQKRPSDATAQLSGRTPRKRRL